MQRFPTAMSDSRRKQNKTSSYPIAVKSPSQNLRLIAGCVPCSKDGRLIAILLVDGHQSIQRFWPRHIWHPHFLRVAWPFFNISHRRSRGLFTLRHSSSRKAICFGALGFSAAAVAFGIGAAAVAFGIGKQWQEMFNILEARWSIPGRRKRRKL